MRTNSHPVTPPNVVRVIWDILIWRILYGVLGKQQARYWSCWAYSDQSDVRHRFRLLGFSYYRQDLLPHQFGEPTHRRDIAEGHATIQRHAHYFEQAAFGLVLSRNIHE